MVDAGPVVDATGRTVQVPDDEPPSVNRLLGLLWAGHTLYPTIYPEDLRAEARDFYRRFYRIELDDEHFEALSR